MPFRCMVIQRQRKTLQKRMTRKLLLTPKVMVHIIMGLHHSTTMGLHHITIMDLHHSTMMGLHQCTITGLHQCTTM